MAQGMGVYSEVLLCPEKKFKTAPASYTGKVLGLPFNKITLAANQNTTDPGTMTGRRDAVEPILGNISVEGDIEFPMDAIASGYWFALAFGRPETTALTGGKYKHVFKPQNTQPSAIVQEIFNNGVILTKDGCKITKMSFSFGGDGELICTASAIGCQETKDTASLKSYATNVSMARFNNFQASLKIGGTTAQVVTQITLDIDFGVDTEGYAIGGNGFRMRANEGIIKPSGTFTAFFDDATYLTMAEQSTKTSLEITLTSGDNVLVIKLPEVKMARTSPSIDKQSGLTQELSYGAFYQNSVENACVLFELTNTHEKYDFGAGKWVASTAFTAGDTILCGTGNSLLATCTTAGTTGATEPTWAVGTVTDGTAEWTVEAL